MQLFEFLDINLTPRGAQLGVPYMKRVLLATTAALALATTAAANPLETTWRSPAGIDAGGNTGVQMAKGVSDLTGPGAPPLIKELVYAVTGMITTPIGAGFGAVFGAVDGFVIEPLSNN
jgi:hypothetical protein